ncbi:drug resistance transporter, EmrB/QacA subfamily [Ornithinimicrobium cerasi]|uniref:Drug resistance transporter, EmrB/QacA subfamily n=1 Tax=Ornithinimicrobium cerasi TaxID=2248773 RepID=A0A285VBQ9_9MICO|nr:drug resistance transporter, EmrB/QacA subfamily [Ornithinimicrobium cerasi]
MWVTSAYLLAYAVPLLITGRLGDRVGRRRVYLTGLTVFTLASLWCGLTGELGMGIGALVAARVVQGLGASMMTPQTMAVITRTFPAERRGSAMALWGATAGVATLAGPLLGGLLVDSLGWEWIFFVNVPVGIVGLVLAARLVPRLETHPHRFDLLGVVLSAVGLFCAVFGIQEGQTYGWGRITGFVSVPLLIGTGLALLVVFTLWQARNPGEPLVPLGLFRDRNFSLATTAITTMGFTATAHIFPLMLWLQGARGLSPTTAALILAPSSVLALVLAPVAGRLTDRVHPRLLVGAGTLLLAAGLLLLSLAMTPDAPLWRAVAGVVVLGLANPLIWGPLSTTATRNLPMHRAGAGAGVYNTTRQVGAVLGSAAIAVLMEARLGVHLGGAGGGLPAEGMAAQGMGAGGAPVDPEVAAAFSRALAESMLLPAAVILVGFLAAMFFERPQHLAR